MTHPNTNDPPTRNLVRHYSFNHIDNEVVLDRSPQDVEGAVSDGTAEQVTGVIGQGVRFDGTTIDVGDVGDRDEFTVSFFIKPRMELDQQSGLNEFQHVIKSSNETNFVVLEEDRDVNFRVPGVDSTSFRSNTAMPIGEYTHVALVYDGNERQIYVDGEIDAVDSVTGGTANLGTVTLGHDTGVNAADRFDFDDFRVYRSVLTDTQIENIRDIAHTHTHFDNFADQWDNAAMPLISTEGNARLAGTLAEHDTAVLQSLDRIIQARHIDDAAGEQLDAIGDIAGVRRQSGESDGPYRARIKGTIIAGQSSGTFDDLLEGISSLLNTAKDNVEFREGWDFSPAEYGHVHVYVRTQDLGDSDIQKADLRTAIEDMVLAGHDVVVHETGDNPFELTNDSQIQELNKGLTSDSDPRGGVLASDV